MRRAVLVSVVGLAVLAGCGESKIDPGRVSDLLRGTRTPDGRVVSVACPSGVEAKAGASFDCKVRTSKGERGVWTVHVVNDDGLVRAALDDLAVGPPARPPSDRDVRKVVVQDGPGGTKVRVGLVKYLHSVHQPSGNSILRNVVGIVLRIDNVGRKPLRAKRPPYYAVLHEPSGAGADVVPGAEAPCGGKFYRSPLRLRVGQSAQGCIPYAVGPPPVDFRFGFGAKSDTWRLQ
jgi:hypothetical protein